MALAFAMGLTNDRTLIDRYYAALYGGPRVAGQLGRAVFYDRTNTPRHGLVDDAGFVSGR